jgi:hypothetical protein
MSGPQEPYDPVDDQTVMRAPRVYRPDGSSAPGAAPEQQPPPPPGPPGPPPYGQGASGQAPYGQAPYGQVPYGQTPYSQAPQGRAPYGQQASSGWQAGPPALEATVVPGRQDGPPSDPYAFSPYAERPGGRSRGPLIAVLSVVGGVVVLGGVAAAVWLGLRDDAPPVTEPPAATQPTEEDVSQPVPEQPVPEQTETAPPSEEPDPAQEVADDEPWLEAQYRAGAEMDPTNGPALAPLSWDFFGDNDYVVQGDRIALTARRDFACDALPAIPAITEGVAGVCQGGFEARVVSHDGPTVALDVVVVETGSKEAAEGVVAAFDAAFEGEPLADTTGPAHATLAAAVPQPGFEPTYEILDAGEGPSVMLSTGSVVILLRLGIGDGLEREQVLPVAQAVGFVVTDHELAQAWDDQPVPNLIDPSAP